MYPELLGAGRCRFLSSDSRAVADGAKKPLLPSNCSRKKTPDLGQYAETKACGENLYALLLLVQILLGILSDALETAHCPEGHCQMVKIVCNRNL